MPLSKRKFVPPPPPPLPPPKKDWPKVTSSKTGGDAPPSLPPLPASLIKENDSGPQNDLPRENGDTTKIPNESETGVAANGVSSSGLAENPVEMTQSPEEGQEAETENAENGTNKEGEKDDKKKPKPATKPSRLKRAFTSGSFTLRKSAAKKESKRLSMTLEDEVNIETGTHGNDLRDAGLWKLPGIDPTNPKGSLTPTSKEKKRSPKTSRVSASSMDESKFKRELSALRKTSGEVTPPLAKSTPHQSKTSTDIEKEIQKRELPPLPTEVEPEDNYSSIYPEPALQSELPAATSSPERNAEESISLENSSKFNDSMTHSFSEDNETPPPLPSRSYMQSTNGSRRTSVITPQKQDTTLQGALNEYGECFPLRFRVLQGYCSETSEINMSTDDVYDIHCMKETKVVTVKSDNGMTHRVPLDSPQKVGLIYNPTHNYEKGLEGHTFRSIADITSAQELPKVIATTQEARSNDGKYLVEENEILIVRQIHRSLFKGKKGLKVLSMMTMAEKLLPEDCVGYFSTKPSLVRLHLSEIVEHVSKPFPVQAVMYTAGDNAAANDQPEVTGVVTMVEYSTETSLTVSAAPFDENLELIPMEGVDFTSSELFDLQLDDDMRALEVGVVQVTAEPEPEQESAQILESESDHTYDDTINIREAGREIDEASVSDESDHVYDDTVAVMKSEDFVLHSSNSHLNDSQQLPHSAAYSDIGRLDPPGDNEFQEEEDGYDTVGLHLLKQAQSKPKSSSSAQNNRSYHSNQFSGDDPMVTSWLEDLQTATRDLEERMAAIESQKNTALEKRLASLESKSSVTRGLEERMVALESKITATKQLEKRMVVLESKTSATKGLEERMVALESKTSATRGLEEKMVALESKSTATRGLEERMVALESKSTATRGLEERMVALESKSTATKGLEERLSAFESQESTTEVTEMKDMLSQLTKKTESLDSQLQTVMSAQSPQYAPTHDETDGDAAQASDGRTTEEINKDYLSSLNMEEVCALLDAMSFSQYKEHIERELVTGDILLEFDDEVLKDELGMKSKIQRIRLMKVINGQYSAKDLLKK